MKAFSEGIIDAVGAKSAIVRQHASNLRQWLLTDALYEVQYVKVSAAFLIRLLAFLDSTPLAFPCPPPHPRPCPTLYGVQYVKASVTA